MGLDELPPSLQVPLLPLLGGVDGAPRAVRWVVTLQRPLPQALREERLHGDVARLLAPHTVSLPPLRHRLEDLPLLVDHLLQQVQVRRGDPLPKTLSWQTLQALQAYPWPGNVTELRRHLERAAQLATSADGPVHLDAPSATEATPPAPKHGLA
jgi:DNA-binding NtrC family response regulator